MRYASRVQRLGGKGAEAWQIHDEALARRRQGEDVILLTAGDPDVPAPAAAVAAAKASLDAGRTGYPPVTGQLELRQAIAAEHARTTGQLVDADQVVVMAGAQCGLFAAMQCLVGAGDEVLVAEPMFVTYPATVAAAGATLVPVPVRAERGFHVDLADLEAAITPATRVLLLNSPNNPTGAAITPEEAAGLADLCIRHDLWLVSDEVYASLVYDRPHVSPVGLPGMAERAVTVSSLSKSHAMTGWRLGWLVGPPEVARHAGRLALCMLFGSPGFIQDAATVALTTDLPEVTLFRQRLRRRRDRVTRRLSLLPGLSCRPPEGGLFIMLDVRGTGMSAETFARGLLAAEGVAVLAGDAFGAPAAGHVRLALTVPDERLAEACNRIGRYAWRLAGRATQRLAALEG